MKRIILAALLAVLTLTPAPALAQTVVVPAHQHRHARTHHRGYLYVAEARLRTSQAIRTNAPGPGVYTIGACHRRTGLAVDCNIQRAFTEMQTATVCDYVSQVRKHVRANGSYRWRAVLRVGGHGCRLAESAH